jgi:hypothetical protein
MWLDSKGRRGECPDFYPIVKACQFMHGAYTMEELADGPQRRVEEILIVQAAEAQVQKVQQERADAQARAKR